MNHELAKKLKDAGFPHSDPPSLSELIEACGGIPYKVSKKDIGGSNRYYVVFDKDDGSGNQIDFLMPTLEEIFATFWLEEVSKK